MTIYPAIDLIDGKAVRLERGDYNRKTQYSDNPENVAKQFAADGASYIHVVDLDGAKAKRPVNLPAIQAITGASAVPIQVGGGIRTVENAAELLKYADRLIIGTVALTDPDKLKIMVDNFGTEKIVVSVDYKAGVPAINGWLETTELGTEDIQGRLRQLGITTVIVTDTDKDGLLDGPNIQLMKQWKQAGFEVICAGGVTTAEDISRLAASGIDGAIIGKALYEGRITLKEAIDAGQ